MPFDRPVESSSGWLSVRSRPKWDRSVPERLPARRLIGAVHFNRGQTMETERPDLFRQVRDLRAQHFQPGDLLAHHQFSVHYAQANHTDKLRWAYTSYRIPARSLYNGIPMARLDSLDLGFELWKPHDHPKFPVVAE